MSTTIEAPSPQTLGLEQPFVAPEAVTYTPELEDHNFFQRAHMAGGLMLSSTVDYIGSKLNDYRKSISGAFETLAEHRTEVTAGLTASSLALAGGAALAGAATPNHHAKKAGAHSYSEKFVKARLAWFSKNCPISLPLAPRVSGGEVRDDHGVHAYIVKDIQGGRNDFKYKELKGSNTVPCKKNGTSIIVTLENGLVKFPKMTKQTSTTGHYKDKIGGNGHNPNGVKNVNFFFMPKPGTASKK